MNSFDLTELHGVDRQADVTVPSKPCSVVLVVRLVAVADIALFDSTMTAHIEDRRQRPSLFFGSIEIAGDVQPGARLKMHSLNDNVFVLNRPDDHRFQWSLRRKRIEAQHFKQVLAVLRFILLPVFLRLVLRQRGLRELRRFCLKVASNHRIAAAGISCRRVFGYCLPEAGHQNYGDDQTSKNVLHH